MLVLFFIIFFYFIFSQSRLIILTKEKKKETGTRFILLKLTACLLLFQSSCGGKCCALFLTGEILNDESSFDITNKKKRRTQRESALASYIVTLWDQSWRLFAQVLVCQVEQKWVTGGKIQGLSSRRVCVWVCVNERGVRRCSTEHIQRTGQANNDSFLRHWCVYSNLGRDDMWRRFVKWIVCCKVVMHLAKKITFDTTSCVEEDLQ